MHSSQVEQARQQIVWAREYTNSLLADVRPEEWLVIPPGAVTHFAWQMGHLAMAQYGLVLLRIRGKEPEDQQFITKDFLRVFKRGSVPVADPEEYPAPEEIRKVFDAVHQQAVAEMSRFTPEQLTDSLPRPTAAYENKLGSLLFCAMHEMLHAGQIGMLRRHFGKAPLGANDDADGR